MWLCCSLFAPNDIAIRNVGTRCAPYLGSKARLDTNIQLYIIYCLSSFLQAGSVLECPDGFGGSLLIRLQNMSATGEWQARSSSSVV